MGKCICREVDLTEYGYHWRRHVRQKLMDSTGHVFFNDVRHSVLSAITPLPRRIMVDDGLCGQLFKPNDTIEFHCGCIITKTLYYINLFMAIIYDYPDFACCHGTIFWDARHLYEAHAFVKYYLLNILNH